MPARQDQRTIKLCCVVTRPPIVPLPDAATRARMNLAAPAPTAYSGVRCEEETQL